MKHKREHQEPHRGRITGPSTAEPRLRAGTSYVNTSSADLEQRLLLTPLLQCLLRCHTHHGLQRPLVRHLTFVSVFLSFINFTVKWHVCMFLLVCCENLQFQTSLRFSATSIRQWMKNSHADNRKRKSYLMPQFFCKSTFMALVTHKLWDARGPKKRSYLKDENESARQRRQRQKHLGSGFNIKYFYHSPEDQDTAERHLQPLSGTHHFASRTMGCAGPWLSAMMV